MRRLIFAILAGALFWLPAEARADVEGPACVLDGNTLSIGGRLMGRQCVGGVLVKLFGVEAPHPKQPCLNRDKKPWACGMASGAELQQLARGGMAVCKGTKKDRYGRVISVCTVGGMDLGLEMVRRGYALADTRESRQYVVDEQNAQIKTLGIWQLGAGSVVSPRAWRQRNGFQ